MKPGNRLYQQYSMKHGATSCGGFSHREMRSEQKIFLLAPFVMGEFFVLDLLGERKDYEFQEAFYL